MPGRRPVFREKALPVSREPFGFSEHEMYHELPGGFVTHFDVEALNRVGFSPVEKSAVAHLLASTSDSLHAELTNQLGWVGASEHAVGPDGEMGKRVGGGVSHAVRGLVKLEDRNGKFVFTNPAEFAARLRTAAALASLPAKQRPGKDEMARIVLAPKHEEELKKLVEGKVRALLPFSTVHPEAREALARPQTIRALFAFNPRAIGQPVTKLPFFPTVYGAFIAGGSKGVQDIKFARKRRDVPSNVHAFLKVLGARLGTVETTANSGTWGVRRQKPDGSMEELTGDNFATTRVRVTHDPTLILPNPNRSPLAPEPVHLNDFTSSTKVIFAISELERDTEAVPHSLFKAYLMSHKDGRVALGMDLGRLPHGSKPRPTSTGFEGGAQLQALQVRIAQLAKQAKVELTVGNQETLYAQGFRHFER